MRIGVLIAGDRVAPWQRAALKLLPPKTQVVVLLATSAGPIAPRQLPKYGAYYALNLLSIRENKVRILDLFENPLIIEFEPETDGNWARLPESLLRQIRDANLDAIIKFGLSLLRVPPTTQLSVPILSYHHGDPREYRGRPAGFYETKHRRESVGQIVQQISNKLDAGRILAFGETPVFPFSYRKTLATAHALSPHLLPRALAALEEGRSEQLETVGHNYRLPSNLSVALYVGRMGWEKLKRVFYGGFVEKRWRVSIMPMDGEGLIAAIGRLQAQASSWRTLDVPKGYTFIADPFFDRRGSGVIVEALEAETGIGRVARIDGDDVKRIDREAHHLSYPCSFEHGGENFIIPEMTAGGRQKVFRFRNDAMEVAFELDIDAVGLIDPTVFEFRGVVYLFANDITDGPSVLRLWTSDSLDARFVEHPASPVRISARGSRMAGPILEQGGRLYRSGQDFRRAYGDGLRLFEIEEMTAQDYRERSAGQLSFDDRSGPHTIDMSGGQLLFDWYYNKIAPLAGWRRLRAKLSRD